MSEDEEMKIISGNTLAFNVIRYYWHIGRCISLAIVSNVVLMPPPTFHTSLLRCAGLFAGSIDCDICPVTDDITKISLWCGPWDRIISAIFGGQWWLCSPLRCVVICCCCCCFFRAVAAAAAAAAEGVSRQPPWEDKL